jgi:TrmH family RNA methyltransferase
MSALSYTNPNLQQLRRLLGRRSARHGDGLFVVEGPLLAAEAVAAGWTCRAQYVPEGSAADVSGAGPVSELAIGVLERVGSTESPQAPLVLVEMRQAETVEVLRAASFVLVLDRLADPGNLGTILRSAEAAGADAVVLTPGSADAYNPKTVRASAGALFHVPVLVASVAEVAATGLRTIGTSSHDGARRTVVPHTEADLSGRIAIILGSEAAGLPAEWTDDEGPIDAWIGIRQHGRTESLNVAMASTVLAFEVARHR